MSNYGTTPSIILDDPAGVSVRRSASFDVAVDVNDERGLTVGHLMLSHEAARDLVGKLTDALAVTS